MDAISQTTFSSAFSWMKMFEFRLKLQVTSHYLNQCWLVYRHIYASIGLNELKQFQVVKYMSGSLTRGGGKNFLGIRGTGATRNFTYLTRSPWLGAELVTSYQLNRWRTKSMTPHSVSRSQRDKTRLIFYDISYCFCIPFGFMLKLFAKKYICVSTYL